MVDMNETCLSCGMIMNVTIKDEMCMYAGGMKVIYEFVEKYVDGVMI